MEGGKLVAFSGTKRRNILKLKLTNLKLAVRQKISETCRKASTTLKESYQPRTNIVRKENGDLFADSYSILARWRNNFSKLLNVHGVYHVRHIQILVHRAEKLLPEPSAYELS
jgi:hypothetical protein